MTQHAYTAWVLSASGMGCVGQGCTPWLSNIIPDHQQGFVLVTVLVMLVVFTVTTGSLAWAVSTRSLGVNSRVGHYQNCLAMMSALEVIDLKLREGELATQVCSEGFGEGMVKLGSASVYYQVWDEAGKYKVKPGSSNVLPGFLADLGVKLRTDQEALTVKWEAASFEDVFEINLDELAKFYGPDTQRKAVVDRVTLWSNGRLNINTASDEALAVHLEGMDTEALKRLLQLRHPVFDLDQVVSDLRLSQRDARIVLSRLTTQTSRLAVRLICQGRTLRSDAFAVIDSDPNGLEILLWRDLPAIGRIPQEQLAVTEDPL